MTTNAAVQDEPAPFMACTISRDVQNFELLIEDMEAECGEGWGDLSFEDATLFLTQPDAESMEFVALAIDQEDEEKLDVLTDLVKLARDQKIRVIVIAEEVSPIALHKLLQVGADEFVPYPLPDGSLHDAIERMRRAALRPDDGDLPEEMRNKMKATGDRNGIVLGVQGLAGGTGSTTFAVNLAWELAQLEEDGEPQRVCLLDLDLQFGAIATYLDLPFSNFCKIRHRWTATVSCRRF